MMYFVTKMTTIIAIDLLSVEVLHKHTEINQNLKASYSNSVGNDYGVIVASPHLS